MAFFDASCVPAIGSRLTLLYRGMSSNPLYEVAFVSTMLESRMGVDRFCGKGRSLLGRMASPCLQSVACARLTQSVGPWNLPSYASRRLRCFSRLQRACSLPCGSSPLARRCQRRRWSVARPLRLSRDGLHVPLVPFPFSARGAEWDDRSLDSLGHPKML